MEIRVIPIDKINEAAYNPRIDLQPGDPEYEKLRRSIETFGYVEPIVWNERTSNMVGGHQRYKIMVHELGRTEIPVSVVDLDDQEERLLNLALNKVSGRWDEEALARLLSELKETGSDFELSGFDEEELEGLLSQLNQDSIISDFEMTEDDFDVEVAISEIDKAVTQAGDLWILGRHRLLCGDSTNQTDVIRLMNGQKAKLVITDPPYGVSYTGGTKEWDMIKNDHLTHEELLVFMDAVYLNISRSIDSACSLYIWHAGSSAPEFILPARKYFEISYVLIWNKNLAQFGNMGSHYKSKHEPCIYMKPKNGKHNWNGPNNEVSVWDVERSAKNEYHPTQKPVSLASRAIINSSKRGEVVLDMFGGSGFTLIAAEQSERTAYLMELDPKYCDVIVKRWEAYTGQTAVRIPASPVVNKKEDAVTSSP